MKTLLLFALLVFVLLAVFGSLVPFDFTPMPFDEAAARIATALTAPPVIVSRIDFVSNVIFVVPLGFLLTGYLALRQSRVHGGVIDVWITLIACVVLSTAIEAIQVFLPSRTVSPSDIMGETLGGLIGAGV
jgi:VanZ family protein